MVRYTLIALAAAAILLAAPGCKAKSTAAKLVIASPHNEDIRTAFKEAFAEHCRSQGQAPVEIEWRDYGGGSTQILAAIRAAASKNGTPGADMVWGGGDQVAMRLEAEWLLVPMKLSQDVRDNVPLTLSGVQMRSKDDLWCGTCISAFGFIYNKQLLEKFKIAPPTRWDDLGKPDLVDLVALADPTMSGTASVAYEMIVQSGGPWPGGWPKLLSVLSNVKRFYNGASDAAKAPETGQAAVATAIDVYGQTRVAAYPDRLVFALPKGQTAFTPDPIEILKGAEHPDLAQRFIDFVMSPQGQALWAVKAGQPGGPKAKDLGRQPIRKDVYESLRGKMLAWIVNPYEIKPDFDLDQQMLRDRTAVLNLLVKAAAIDNREVLQAARKKLIKQCLPAEKVAEFNRLPDNVSTPEKLRAAVADVRDTAKADVMLREWTAFFKAKYEALAK